MKKPMTSQRFHGTAFSNRSLRHEIRRLLAASSVGLLATSFPGLVSAGPEHGQVVAGEASISQGAGVTTIDQFSARAVINWESFNVGANESVHFKQPNASSATLNRVMGNDPSNILGRISANGQVFLVNPNGVLFGRTAQIDVGSLVASTANIADPDFMSGRMRFSETGKAGAVVENAGIITVADGGFAALVGAGVRNSGIINARLGKVSLASGDAFTLDLHGDQLINLIVDPSTLVALTDARGVPLTNYVDHTGSINAEGGRVALTVSTAKRLLDNVVNVSGIIRATGFESRAGTISLVGDAETQITVSGALDASGSVGGQVDVTGRDVRMTSTATVTAAGRDGDGGSVFIGGNWQGQGSLANAQQVTVDRGALISANAGANGNGGTVVVWSDDNTAFSGAIEATGGAESGVGGQVEVSGKQQLGFDGDVRAASLLLDPTNVIFDGATGSPFLPGSATGDYTVRVDAVNRQLINGTAVTIQASNDITVNENAVLGGSSTSVQGGALTLDAGNNIALNGSVVLNNGHFRALAGGTFSQGSNSVVATGSGNIDVHAVSGIQASTLR